MASVGIIGSGMSGLVTAKTLSDDGFDVQILTREHSPGGVWSGDRVYPGLKLNNVSGEYRFSYLPAPMPADAKATGGRLTGEVMQSYFESFEQRFLRNLIRYRVEVLGISRNQKGKWTVKIRDIGKGEEESLQYDKIVLCTGGCSRPFIPPELSPESATKSGFTGLVTHSRYFKANVEKLLSEVQPGSEKPIVVVGGGKSAQDATTFLVNQGRKVTMIFDKADNFIAAKTPLPDVIRKGRLLSVLSPHIHLRTMLERFLHTTWLGSQIVKLFWWNLERDSYAAFDIPADSPFRNTFSNFYSIRTNDEGVGSPGGFFSLVKEKKFEIIAPIRVTSFSPDGKGVVLVDGRYVEVAAVVLATGYTSSWDPLFSSAMRVELGLDFNVPSVNKEVEHRWDNYLTLKNPPFMNNEQAVAASSIYRGLIPARNLFKRDFAVNGASFTTNMGYVCEVQAHWISSYFLGDSFLKLAASAEDALAAAHLKSAWLRKRYPGTSAWVNESYSADIAFWDTYQACDDLLEDMGLPIMRSGGNWFNWPFKVVDLKEIETLHAERAAKRDAASKK